MSAPVLISATDALTGSGLLALLLPIPGLLWLIALPIQAPSEPARDTAGPRPLGPPRRQQDLVLRAAAGWVCIVLAVAAEFAFLVWGAARLQDCGLGASAAAGAAAAFPIGMAAGRFAGPRLLGVVPVVGLGGSLAIAAAVAVAAPLGAVTVTAALAAAGLGIATLYPIALARLVHTPGMGSSRGAFVGATASGAAVLAAPSLLDALAGAATLRVAFLAIVPVLAILLLLQRAATRWAAPA